MTRDPICGMTVDETTAISATRDGQTVYFCSEHCREKFLSTVVPSPAVGGCCGGKRVMAPPPAAASCCGGKSHDHAAVIPAATAKYFCPMCPGVESDKPGDCPKCGMALERNPAWKSAAQDDLHLPDAPGDRAGSSRRLPEVRHGAGTEAAAGRTMRTNGELRDMTRRLWIGAALTLPVFLLAMAHLIPGAGAHPG